eukprot:jgi/Phyca11/101358/e_gw1.5.915.1
MGKQASYTIKEKRQALAVVQRVGVYRAAENLGYPRRTVGDWWKQRDSIVAFEGSAKSKTLKGQGRKEMIPFSSVLVTFMKDQRRQELFVTTSLLMEFIRDNFNEWLDDYYENKKSETSGTQALQRLCQRFMHRHGFTDQAPQEAKIQNEYLEETHLQFSLDFWSKYAAYGPHEIYNVDETAIYYEMFPRRTWSERGGSARVVGFTEKPGRMTAVLTIRADGQMVIVEETCATVCPLPPNSTSVCQPLDVGVMGPLKNCMRGKWRQSKKAATPFQKRLNAVQLTIAAWESLKPSTIVSSFEKAVPRFPTALV